MVKERCAVSIVGVLLASAVCVAVHSAQALDEPDGFGRAKFGMHVEEVQKLYPDMRATLAAQTPEAGKTTLSFPVTGYALGKQSVGPLQQCDVELRFFLDELFEIQFRCPDKEEVTRYLKNRFGQPAPGGQSSLLWRGQKASVTHVPQGGTFAFGDMERTKAETVAVMGFIAKASKTPGAVVVGSPVAAAPPATPRTSGGSDDERLLHHLTVLAEGAPDMGTAPLQVHFSPTLFEDLDHPENPRFSWNFDDGSPPSNERGPAHVFKKPGTYKVRLEVTDANNKRGSAEVQIDVDASEPKKP